MNVSVSFLNDMIYSEDGDVILNIREFPASKIRDDYEYGDFMAGTPQEGNISLLLANIMPREPDKKTEQRSLNYVRYVNNCIIMIRNEMEAKCIMRNIPPFYVRTSESKEIKKSGSNKNFKILVVL